MFVSVIHPVKTILGGDDGWETDNVSNLLYLITCPLIIPINYGWDSEKHLTVLIMFDT